MRSTLVSLSIGSILSLTDAKPLDLLQSRATVTIPGYDYAGCYSEVPGYALNEKISYSDSMTLESCAASCADFTWWGVEYGRECYCGNTLHTGSVAVPAASCFFSCPGDSSEICGAGNHLTMYARIGTITPASSTPPTYGSLGCYTEATTQRALIDVSISNTQMTVENCAAACLGYSMFGVEYSRECYCGNTLQSGSVKTLDSACSYPCAGNSGELCGGASHLNLYQFGAASVQPDATVTTFNRQGCYGETYPTRALSDKSYFDDAMTVEKCAKACAGYTYFGLEYGRECYCGHTILPASVTTGIADAECNFPCPGDSTEHCGAGNRIDMYEFGAPSSSSSTSSSLSSTLSSTSSTTTSVAPTITSSTSSSPSSSSSSSSSTSSSSSAPTPPPLFVNTMTTSAISLANTFYGQNMAITIQYQYMMIPGPGYDPSLISLTRTGGQPYIPGSPAKKLYVLGADSNHGSLGFETSAQAAQSTTDYPVTCSVSSQGSVSCSATTGSGLNFNTVFSCGPYVILGLSTFASPNCLATTMQLIAT